MNTIPGNKDHFSHINDHVCVSHCVSWTAIIIGALVAIAFSFLLNLLCLGIGISAFPSTENGQLVYAVSGFIVLVICAVLAMFPAGYVAGKLARPHCFTRRKGELHGLAAWTVALIISILLGSSVGKFINETTYMVTRQPVDVRLNNLSDNQVYAVDRNANNPAPVKVAIDPENAANATAMAMFATFFIFFIGMLSACFGGRVAIMCCNREKIEHAHCEQCNKV